MRDLPLEERRKPDNWPIGFDQEERCLYLTKIGVPAVQPLLDTLKEVLEMERQFRRGKVLDGYYDYYPLLYDVPMILLAVRDRRALPVLEEVVTLFNDDLAREVVWFVQEWKTEIR